LCHDAFYHAVLRNFDLLLFQLMSLLRHEAPRYTISYNIRWVDMVYHGNAL
jgi:hypothetical protein